MFDPIGALCPNGNGNASGPHKGGELLRAVEDLEVRIRCLLDQTPSLSTLAESLALAATHDVPVLITGEPGTGKTRLARWIHQCSPRRQHPLQVASCGALSPSVVECELFGHVPEALTAADQIKGGRFEAAGAGTILLDEIDTLGLAQQASLLRVIETGKYERVGTSEIQVSQARIAATSHSRLAEKVAAGEFRHDLFLRLSALVLHLPPLRERPQDMAPLTKYLVANFAEKFFRTIGGIHADVITALQAFSWPGNIRQLENAIQQAILHCSGPRLLVEHLPQSVLSRGRVAPARRESASTTLFQNRQKAERDIILSALKDNQFNRARAASALGVSRVTLYKKIKKYGLTEGPHLSSSSVGSLNT